MQAMNISFETDFVKPQLSESKPVEYTQGVSFLTLVKQASESDEHSESETTVNSPKNEKVQSKNEEKISASPQKVENEKETEAEEDEDISHLNALLEQTNNLIEKISENNSQKIVKASDSETKEIIPTDKIEWVAETSNKDYLSELIENAEEYVDPKLENIEEQLLSAQREVTANPEAFLTKSTNIQTLEESGKEYSLVAKKSNSNKKKTLADIIDVKDLRTQKDFEKDVIETSSVKKNIVTSVKSNNNEMEMSLNLNNQAQKNILTSDSQSASANGSTFQAMLTNQIQNNASDIVKAGSIVLKDNNQGTINLIMHPESLGNVKINLSLDDKSISGKIIVSSQEAYNAFKESIDSLKQAFSQSGFDVNSFDLSFSSQGQSFSGNQKQNENMQHEINRTYGEFVNENISVDSNNADIQNVTKEYSVNIVT